MKTITIGPALFQTLFLSIKNLSICAVFSLFFIVTSLNAAPHQAFGTSTSGNGNLSSWADAGGQTGLAAGDAICQARATAAGLSNPDQFVAWLSDGNNDAYCRVSSTGLNGTETNSCGQASLPTGAGPWVRTDGLPFASTIENALRNIPGLPANFKDGVVFSPMQLDENGNALPILSSYFTATFSDGKYDSFPGHGDCALWTSGNNNLVASGSSRFTTNAWTSAGAIACSTNAHLICMQKNSGPAFTGYANFGHQVAFVTNFTKVSGNLSLAPPASAIGATGIAAGDAICRAVAKDVGHFYQPQSFKAFLTTVAAGNITTRFQFDGPWYRPDGLLFAHTLAEIASGLVKLPPNVDETGDYFGSSGIWTGANGDGSPSGKDCSGWTTNAAAIMGTFTYVNSIGPSWLNAGGPLTCSFSNTSLLCLADIDVIFHNEFELLP